MNDSQATITQDQLELINTFSRRALSAEEVYIFSLVLCDNEVDRDFERFPTASLQKLSELFVGKTGIFDHNPKGQNQTARIFDTTVETDPSKSTQAGEPYSALRAWAYMVRCDKNADLILEIDAGIKKEVSVGCSVDHQICSVCGVNIREKSCSHELGQTYGGVLCWHDLADPVDAYEWSFVAVPAQKMAGVTKGISASSEEIVKSLDSQCGVTLTKAQASQLSAHIRELDALARGGRQYLDKLRCDFIRLSAFSIPGVDAQMLEEVSKGLTQVQLEAFCKGLSQKGPFISQFETNILESSSDNRRFCI